MNDIDRMRFESLQDSYDSLKQQLAQTKEDAALWRARLHTYLMYRPPADSTARDAILDCELKVLSDENKPTFDEWIAAIDAAIDQAMKEKLK